MVKIVSLKRANQPEKLLMNKNTNPFIEQTKQPQKWSTYFRTRQKTTVQNNNDTF
jgi:hypothetical protein